MSSRQAWKLNSPNDNFQFDTTCVKNLQSGLNISSLPASQRSNKEPRKKKKAKLEYQDEINNLMKKKPNYFQKMYKETEKRMKLKQIITRSENFHHPLYETQQLPDFYNVKTFLIKPELQIAFCFFSIICILFSSLYSAIVLVFMEAEENQMYKAISILTVIALILQFFLKIFSRSSININSKNSEYYLYAKQSALNYFKSGWMVIDLLIILSYAADLFLVTSQMHFSKLLILLKFYPMVNQMRNLQILLIKNCYKEQFWQIVKIFIFNFIFAHFIAIVLLLMAQPQGSWFQLKKIDVETPWSEKYIWAYYWATTIMFTVGFGDISPTNITEATVMIFIQSISCIVLAYNIANVSRIVNKITSYEIQKVQNLKIFTQMQKQEPISEQIQKKITNYIIESAELKRNFNVNEEKQLLNILPKTFYEQLKKQSTNRIFSSIPFFRNLKFTKLQQLAIKIDKKLTHPEEIIVQAGNIPEVLIINNGHISYNMNRVGLKSHGKQIQSFKIQSNQFKIVSMYFFIRKPINYDIKCKDYTILYSISQKELENCLSTNPYSYEYYCMYKDKDRFNECDWEIEKCTVCDKVRHSHFNCPKLHYIPLRNMVVAKAIQKGSSHFKHELIGRRRRLCRVSINSLKYFSQIETIFKNIQISQKVKDFIKLTKKKSTVKWGKINTIEFPPHQYFVNSKKPSYIINQPQSSRVISSQDELTKKGQSKYSIFIDTIEEEYQNYDESSLMMNRISSFQQNSGQIENMMKIQYLKQFSRKQKQNILFQDVCKQLTDRLKDEIAKNTGALVGQHSNDLNWLPIDVAHNYGFYFQSDNPGELKKRWKKKYLKRKKLNLFQS